MNPERVLGIILGGGRGTRLYPLTAERAKPAVPLGGKYRLVDIPISNCINSKIWKILLLTQFNSASLHRHVYATYRFDRFSGGFVEILAAEQTPSSTSWYEGTADAVRKNLHHLDALDFDYALILSGDQLYRMDFRELLKAHTELEADITVAAKPVSENQTHALGIMAIDSQRRIVKFVEKPQDPKQLEELALPVQMHQALGIKEASARYLASMGIYLFNRNTLYKALQDHGEPDFGKHIIPLCIQKYKVCSYVFQGYWEDIGTIKSFYEANLDLTSELPQFNLFDPNAPIYTRPRALPPAKINGASLDHVIVADGSILNRCQISNSIIGLRTIIEEGTVIRRSIIMGADYYELEQGRFKGADSVVPPLGIGPYCRIENAIIDKNARIGKGCVITPYGKPENMDGDKGLYYIRDGIVVIPKNRVIPDGTII